MTEREAVEYIHKKTQEASKALLGKVVFGVWNKKTGAVCITDDIHEVVARIVRDHDVIGVYAEGWELETLGRKYGEYGEMIHMNRRLYEKIRSM